MTTSNQNTRSVSQLGSIDLPESYPRTQQYDQTALEIGLHPTLGPNLIGSGEHFPFLIPGTPQYHQQIRIRQQQQYQGYGQPHLAPSARSQMLQHLRQTTQPTSEAYNQGPTSGPASQLNNLRLRPRRQPFQLHDEPDEADLTNQSIQDTYSSFQFNSMAYANPDIFRNLYTKAYTAPHPDQGKFTDFEPNFESPLNPADLNQTNDLAQVGLGPGLDAEVPLLNRTNKVQQGSGPSSKDQATGDPSIRLKDMLEQFEMAIKSIPDPSNRTKLSVSIESMKSLLAHVPGMASSEPPVSPSPQLNAAEPLVSRDAKTNKEVYFCRWEGCNKTNTPKTPAEFKKHVRRHTKPYACTFVDDCSGRFGSKKDLKRHEVTQHHPLDGWRCGEKNHEKGGITCKTLFDKRSQFQKHLHRDHAYKQAKIKILSRKCHISRTHEGRYWCGFCREIIKLAKKGVEGENERFSHICDHLLGKTFEKQPIDDWLPPEGHKTKKELVRDKNKKDEDLEGESSYSDTTSDAGDEDSPRTDRDDANVRPVQEQRDVSGDSLPPIQAGRKRPHSTSDSDDSAVAECSTYVSNPTARVEKSRKKHKESLPATHTICCQCPPEDAFSMSLHICKRCLSCSHKFCDSCTWFNGD